MLERRIGISQYPDFIVFENPYSNWGQNLDIYGFSMDLSTPPDATKILKSSLDYLFTKISALEVTPIERKKVSEKGFEGATSILVSFEGVNPTNALKFQFMKAEYDNGRKIYLIGAHHFNTNMVFDTKKVPQRGIRDVHSENRILPTWLSPQGMVNAGSAISSPLGPRQVDQYVKICKFTADTLYSKAAKIKSLIVTDKK